MAALKIVRHLIIIDNTTRLPQIQRPALLEGKLEGGVSEISDACLRVKHAKGHTASLLELVNCEPLHVSTTFRRVHHLHLAIAWHHKVCSHVLQKRKIKQILKSTKKKKRTCFFLLYKNNTICLLRNKVCSGIKFAQE